MKIEELAEFSGTQLAKLSDQQLDEILRPYYSQTRPEQVVREPKKQKEPELQIYLSPQKQAVLAQLESEGVDISFMKKKFKK